MMNTQTVTERTSGPVSKAAIAPVTWRQRLQGLEKASFVGPAVAYLACLTLFPFFYSVYLSLHQVKLTRLDRKFFIGLENYVELFRDPLFVKSILNTATLTVSSIGIEVVVGFLAAKIFFQLRHLKVSQWLRTAVIMPMMITPICIGLIFSYILNPTLGIVSYLTTVLGGTPLAWFGDENLALLSVILINAWQWTPFMMLLMLAGLMSIPTEQYEAADLEGARWYHIARRIELPSIRNVLLIGIILRVIECLRLFDLVYVTTRGGPGDATELITFFAYRQDFRFFNVGYGSAAAVVILAMSLIITTIAVTYMRKGDHD